MFDLMLVIELVWCSLLIGVQGAERALLYSGGILASGYAAAHLSGWLAKVLLPPPSAAFLWVEAHLSITSPGVPALAEFIPAEPVASGVSQAAWITTHIVQALFFIGITVAIFLLFLVSSYLSDALFDRPPHANRGLGIRLLTPLLAVSTGLYLTFLTGMMLGNLAWLEVFSGFTGPVSHSLGMHWIGHIVRILQSR